MFVTSHVVMVMAHAVILFTSSDASISQMGGVPEYCHMDTFQARCTHGEVISMTMAVFGRMRVGRCIASDAFQLQHPDSLGCSADVLDYFDRVCSGKSACDVLVLNPDLYSYRPCSAHLSMYLEASYICVSVVDEDRSCSATAAVGSPIYISNMPKSQLNDDGSRCGSRTNPWIIEAQTGQRISISLLDFGPQQRRPEDGATSQTVAVERLQPGLENCTMSYGYIVEKAATNKRNTTICSNGAGDLRDRFVYQSTGSAIEMVLSSTQSSGAESFQNKFLVGFKAVGCSNLVPPADAWLRRTDNEATIGCYTTRQRWQLRCHEGQWKGTIGRCADEDDDGTGPGATSRTSMVADVAHTERRTLTNTLAVVTVAFIGLAFCLVIIFVGIGCSQRYQRQLRAVKAGQHPVAVPPMLQKTVNCESQSNENTAFRLPDGRHQYFVLERDDKEIDSAQTVLRC